VCGFHVCSAGFGPSFQVLSRVATRPQSQYDLCGGTFIKAPLLETRRFHLRKEQQRCLCIRFFSG